MPERLPHGTLQPQASIESLPSSYSRRMSVFQMHQMPQQAKQVTATSMGQSLDLSRGRITYLLLSLVLCKLQCWIASRGNVNGSKSKSSKWKNYTPAAQPCFVQAALLDCLTAVEAAVAISSCQHLMADVLLLDQPGEWCLLTYRWMAVLLTCWRAA